MQNPIKPLIFCITIIIFHGFADILFISLYANLCIKFMEFSVSFRAFCTLVVSGLPEFECSWPTLQYQVVFCTILLRLILALLILSKGKLHGKLWNPTALHKYTYHHILYTDTHSWLHFDYTCMLCNLSRCVNKLSWIKNPFVTGTMWYNEVIMETFNLNY